MSLGGRGEARACRVVLGPDAAEALPAAEIVDGDLEAFIPEKGMKEDLKND